MNEQLQNALTEILNKTINGIDSSVEFMEAQLPDVIEQLLMWYAVKGLIQFTVGFAVLVAFSVLIYKAVKSRPTEGENIFWVKREWRSGIEFSFGWVVLIVLVGVFLVPISFASMLSIFDTVQISIAPKLWLIEYAANLVN